VNAGPGTLERIRGALASSDFRKLVGIRLVSQSSDGLFQAALVASVVFLSPEDQDTAVGFLKATLVIALPYSILGPFTGVFIDRWRRKRILVLAPWVKAGLVGLVLFDATGQAFLFYAGALLVLSVNRFFLSTAAAIVPRVVPHEDLLVANSLATVGGTVALLVGVFVGGRAIDAIADAFPSIEPTMPVVIAAGIGWLTASWIASRIRSELKAHMKPEDPELLRHELRRVAVEFRDGARRLLRTRRAIGPITSITIDQIGQGIVLVISLVVFRQRFGEGVASFSNLIGAGGVGVLVGILTVGKLEERLPKPKIVATGFVVGGLALVAVSFLIRDWSVLLASFAVGMTFAWKKISVDTMVQESIPDGYRGRIFSVYDVVYNLARVVAAALAIPMLEGLSDATCLVVVGVAFLLWAPVIGPWFGREPELAIRFYAGGRGDEVPRALVWGGFEEPVEPVREWREERDGERRLAFRLALADGTEVDVSRPEPDGPWRLDREGERRAPDGRGPVVPRERTDGDGA
jgi:predicted MFS family arabinose efflux permease